MPEANRELTYLEAIREALLEEMQRDAKVFRRNVVGLVPLRLQLLTLGSKDFRQPFDRAGDELVSLFHGLAGLIHEADLNLLPA